VLTPSQLTKAIAALASESVVGLDVETTLAKRALCLIQIAGRGATYLIDALELPDLEPLGQLLANGETAKLIHYARSNARSSAGRASCWTAWSILARYRSGSGPPQAGTTSGKSVHASLAWNSTSRSRPAAGPGGPLTESQVTYAALDAEVLLRLFARFQEVTHTPRRRPVIPDSSRAPSFC